MRQIKTFVVLLQVFWDIPNQAFTVYASCSQFKTAHAKLTEHRALRHKPKSCTVPFLYRSDLVKSRRMLYHPDVCDCTMPYVPRTVPAYAVRDPAYTAEVFALTLVEIDVSLRIEN